MTDPFKGLDWIDIGLHCGVALLWGGLCGLGFHWGYELTSIVALGLGLVFWPVRELSQHEWQFGHHQSQWEWIAPDIVSVIAGAAILLLLNAG